MFEPAMPTRVKNIPDTNGTVEILILEQHFRVLLEVVGSNMRGIESVKISEKSDRHRTRFRRLVLAKMIFLKKS